MRTDVGPDNRMNFHDSIAILLFLVVSQATIADEEMSDQMLPVEMRTPADSMLEPIDFFLALPEKVLPLSIKERAEALKEEKIRQWGREWDSVVTWNEGIHASVATRVIAYTADHRPVLDVIYSWKNPGMILKFHHYRYHCTRLAGGWLVERVSLGSDVNLDSLFKWGQLGPPGD
jgi:hypothetical protein